MTLLVASINIYLSANLQNVTNLASLNIRYIPRENRKNRGLQQPSTTERFVPRKEEEQQQQEKAEHKQEREGYTGITRIKFTTAAGIPLTFGSSNKELIGRNQSQQPLQMNNHTAFLLQQSLILATESSLQNLSQRSSLVNESLLDAFRQAKSTAGRLPSVDQPLKDIYRQCIQDFRPISGYDQYATMNALQQRQVAEAFFKRQEGKIWIQHSRKAGGTTLCMLLRLNEHGLIRARPHHWTMPKRETCQIPTFCVDCDLTCPVAHLHGHYKFQGWETIPRLVDCLATTHHQNFFEVEGTVSPPTILSDPEWANFVFVSTMRHPIARIISSLHNDPPYQKPQLGCYKSDNPKKLNQCARAVLFMNDQIMNRCGHGIYFCYSNYYVRMFAGHPNGVEYPVTRKTLERAKEHFRRYSCVVLLEHWTETSHCLATKLGLHLTSQEGYNVQGSIKEKVQHKGALLSNQTKKASLDTFSESLTNDEYGRLLELNTLDLEFYNWAKDLILSGFFM